MREDTMNIVSSNIQKITSNDDRIHLLTHYSKRTTADTFLLQEMSLFKPQHVPSWTEDCESQGLQGIFVQGSHTAIIWRKGSRSLQFDTTSVNALHELSPFLKQALRSTDVKMTAGDRIIRLVSVYIPVDGSQRVKFLPKLREALAKLPAEESILIAGDWNCVLDSRIDSSNPLSYADQGTKQLEELLANLELVDAYRYLYPLKQSYTNLGTNGTERRLDRFYLAQDLYPLIQSWDNWKKSKSTHIPVKLTLRIPGSEAIGPGIFKLGSHIVNRPWMGPILCRMVVDCHAKSKLKYPDDPFQAWDYTKCLLSRELQSLIKRLHTFDKAHKSENTNDEFLSNALKARMKPADTGTSSVKLRVKQVRASSWIPNIVQEGKTFSTPGEKLEVATNRLKALFCRRPTDVQCQEQLLNNVTARLTPDQRCQLEETYELELLTDAMRECLSSSCPGGDGLSSDFYRITWDVTGPILLELKNLVHERKGQLSDSQKSSIVSLIHKRNEKNNISNYRPIRCFNVDAKIFAKADKMRLSGRITDIIEETQIGFMPGRHIRRAPAELLRAVEEEDDHPGYLAIMDFKEAYDRLDHAWLRKVLPHLNFGRKAISNIVSTYEGHTAQVMLNGWLGESFLIDSGIGQGSSLACFIYAIAVEPFLRTINKEVQGLPSNCPYNLKEIAFADDTNSGLKDRTDCRTIIRISKVFEKASGSLISTDKSFFYPLGVYAKTKDTMIDTWKIRTTDFDHLGVPIGRGVKPIKVWQDMASKMATRFTRIPLYDVPIAGRCHIVNTFIYSKMFYLDQFIPCPIDIVEQIESNVLVRFWRNQPVLVRKEVLQTSKKQGGFGLLPLLRQLLGARASWIYELLYDDNLRWVSGYCAVKVKLMADLARIAGTIILHPDNNPRRIPTKHYWRWETIFFPVPVFVGNRLQLKIERQIQLLPERWKKYREAWTMVIQLRPELMKLQGWMSQFMASTSAPDPNRLITKPQDLIQSSVTKDEIESIIQITQHRKDFFTRQPTIISNGWRKRFADIRDEHWQWYWSEALQKIRSDLPEEVDTAHLFSLFYIQPFSRKTEWSTHKPKGEDHQCSLCKDVVIEDFQHLFCNCPTSQRIWQYSNSNNLEHPTLKTLLCPYQVPLHLIIRYVVFLHEIKQLSDFQRYSRVAEKSVSLERMRITGARVWRKSTEAWEAVKKRIKTKTRKSKRRKKT